MLAYQAIIKSDTATRLLNVFTFEYIILSLPPGRRQASLWGAKKRQKEAEQERDSLFLPTPAKAGVWGVCI